MAKTSKKIVVLGGGTGAPVIIQSLLQAGYTDLKVISTSMDSGGRTGIVRTDERDRVTSIADLLHCLLALVHPKLNHKKQVAAFLELADFTDGRKRNLGYSLYYGLLEKYANDFVSVQRHLERLLDISFCGTAIPVTLFPAHICFSTESKAVYRGEHELDRLSMSANTVTNMWLDPSVPATIAAQSTIKSATHLIYAPGSIYGSILANFLPNGMTSAIASSKAQKILLTNLVSTRNQTHGYSPMDYIKLFRKYTEVHQPVDILVSPHLSRPEFENSYPKIAKAYAWEHSYFLGWDQSQLNQIRSIGITTITPEIFSVTPKLNRLRHDPTKLSRVLKKLIH